MNPDLPVTETQNRFDRGSSWRAVAFVLYYLVLFLGLTTLGTVLYAAYLFQQTYGVTYLDDKEKHFKYGSIGAELANGLPYRLFRALPNIFPEEFGKEGDYSHFGFIYETDTDGKQNDLPIGFARGFRNSIEVAWFNCAVCHTGMVRIPGSGKDKIVIGMPANTVDLERFFFSLFRMVEDKDFSWERKKFQEEINKAGDRPLTFIERFLWAWLVVPNTRNTLLDRRNRLLPLLDPSKTDRQIVKNPSAHMCKPADVEANSPYAQDCKRYQNELTIETVSDFSPVVPTSATTWGPGRVDTFNPYKLINFNLEAHCLKKDERIGIADFPSIYLQAPRGRQVMHLHWDGNNSSLDERNLSAAIGAGVTEETVNHQSLAVIAEWLGDLKPAPSPYKRRLNKESLARGKAVYMNECTECHGYQSDKEYVFTGARLGKIEPLQYVGTDPYRIWSYTSKMEEYQKEQLFCLPKNRRYRFKNFKNTNGYANMPLDGLWLRAPYLHNGSVPTLADLLKPPPERPTAFRRSDTKLDPLKGGFTSPPCSPESNEDYALTGKNFCFDTAVEGNSNKGHEYGTYLSDEAKDDLLTYLLSF